MSEKDNNVMPLATDPHNLGEFDNVYDGILTEAWTGIIFISWVSSIFGT